MEVMVGVDIGQKRDPTAICVAEQERREVENREDHHFLVRYLERLPLGTPYPRVADRVAGIVKKVQARADSKFPIYVYVDATGVGQPVVDLIREQITRGTVVAVYFTHGDRRTTKVEGGGRCVTLGKAYLVSRLQALLQAGRLHLPRTSEAEVLTEELLNYEIRVTKDANDTYGAFRVGTHDDLVTALGLAVQVDYPVLKVNISGRSRRRRR